ncbi:MAG: glycosyl transferase [Ignavibacteria bacterium GWA2_35_9]|nr:MAG: glycosyl transferase [Ignavibacteria bacterium GWA2_35_9]OGU46746.1 MAG: glycosyl transferase [Ignavibacteria bacterium GWB2_36_8]OGU50648.1 MAG: glycosyl transferase [Ignavibacteria bacterium GWC2_36_12]
MNSLAPIILFVYNRPEYTRQTIESLKKSQFASGSELFIYSDAAKTEKDKKLVAEVRDYIKTINGFRKVIIKESKENKGLALSITSGVSEILNKYDNAIILEDDLELSPFFLKYMNEALSLYEKEEDVISIHGYVYPVKKKLPETFFLRGADCWGWATWKRGWKFYEDNASKLLSEITSKNLKDEFDFNRSYPYTKMLKNQIKGEINSWAIKWYASAFVNNKLTLYPGKSLVRNVGTTVSSTHFEETNVYDVELSEVPVNVKNIEIKESVKEKKIFEEYFRSINSGIVKKGLKKIKTLLK